MRALTPIARVRSRQLPINVLDELGKIVVRLRVEEPTAIGADDHAVALRPRLHVIGVLGYDRELRDVSALLDRARLRPASRPVQDDAVEALGGMRRRRLVEAARASSSPSERADEAAADHRSGGCSRSSTLNLPGTLADTDTEFLHDLRVAVRRTRALQRELRGVFAPEPLRAYRDGFKELQRITGPTRDLDVQLLEFGELSAGLPEEVAGDVAPLRRLLEDHLVVERRAMVRALRSARDRARCSTTGASTSTGSSTSHEAERPDAARPVADVAGERIAKVYRQMVKMGSAIDDDSPHEALHDLRKKGKELRYLLEFFASLYPERGRQADGRDAQGRCRTCSAASRTARCRPTSCARSATRSRRSRAGPPRSWRWACSSSASATTRTRRAREFAETFAGFAAKSQRKLVDQTFG